MDQAKKDRIRKRVIYTAGAIAGSLVFLFTTYKINKIMEHFARRDPEYRAWEEHVERVQPLIDQIEDAFDDFKGYRHTFNLDGNRVTIEERDIESHSYSIDSLIVTIHPTAAGQEHYQIIDLGLNGLSDNDMIEDGQGHSYDWRNLSLDEQQKVRQTYERILRHPKVLNVREYLQEEQARREEAQRINKDNLRKARENKIDHFYRKFR